MSLVLLLDASSTDYLTRMELCKAKFQELIGVDMEVDTMEGNVEKSIR